MNKIILLGRLTRDPETKSDANGNPCCRFTLAVNSLKRAVADFIPVIAYGANAEPCIQYLHKGNRALVEGHLRIRSYEAQDGTKRTSATVFAERVLFVETKASSNASDTNEPDEEIPF